jgi:hypothetical protein
MPPASDPFQRIQSIRAAFPEGGFFRDKEWVLSPSAFPLDEETVKLIEDLGPALLAFQSACNALYLESAEGKQHPWVSALLDQGKPAALVALSRKKAWQNDLPRVIRPDLVLTENGVCISELDSIPGGIGLTAWLNQTYARLGDEVIGGEHGMPDGFAAAFPSEDILISRESADYQPEMEWLVEQLNHQSKSAKRAVMNPWNITSQELNGASIYRFFELFDLENVERSDELLKMADAGELQVTPPFKPYLEEKLWLALFWVPQLEGWWRESLSEKHWDLLRACIPFGWVLNPAPLPVTAVYPELGIHSWEEMKSFGRKQRELVVKISGFSERGWGSRGVFIGHDLSQEAWGAAIDEALASFAGSPFVMQRFRAGRVLNHPAWRDEKGMAELVQSRVRLCPYYFVVGEEARLSGALATVCPADKKILHGMRDAMMLPCRLKS